MPALTQVEVNSLLDYRYRGQGSGARTASYMGLMIVMPTRATPGTEASTGAGYTGCARQSFPLSLTNVSGTQSDGSTSASSGTREYVSNNVAINFSSSLAAAWNNIVAVGFFDALTGGALREWYPITDDAGTPIVLSRNAGESFIIAPAQLRFYAR